MNKRITLILFLTFISGLVFSQSITVKTPNGGENWMMGSTQEITWNASGFKPGDKIKIVLLNNGKVMGLIKKNLNPSAGSHSWLVGKYEGKTAPTGSHYKIRIKKQGSGDIVKDESDTKFTLSTVQIIPIITLKVDSPKEGAFFCQESTAQIHWITNLSGNVKIIAKRIGGGGGILTTAHPAQESFFSWDLPEGWPAGKYFIRVKQKTIHADSGKFDIHPYKMKVLSPKKYDIWKEGETREIKWHGGQRTKYSIYLYYEDLGLQKSIGSHKTPFLQQDQSYSFKWKIPTDVCEYQKPGIPPYSRLVKVFVQTDDHPIGEFGEKFIINNRSNVVNEILRPVYVRNRYQSRYEKFGTPGTMGTAPIPPWTGKVRVGFQTIYPTGVRYRYIFRSNPVFDVQQLSIDANNVFFYQGKRAVLLEAKLILKLIRNEGNQTGYSFYCGNLYILNSVWQKGVNECTDTPGTHYCNLQAGGGVVKHQGGQISINIQGVLEDWIKGEQNNHGVLIGSIHDTFESFPLPSVLTGVSFMDASIHLKILITQ